MELFNLNQTSNTSAINETSITLDLLDNVTDLMNFTNFTGYNYNTNSNDDILKTLFLPIIVCSGIIGIVLTVIVLSRKTMCTSTNCYLTSLAVADLLFLLILSVLILLDNFTRKPPKNIKREVIHVLHHYLTILMNTFHNASVWVTVMLAVERYIAICHPLRAMAICTIKRARIVVVIIFFLAFIVRIPNFFDIEYIKLPNTWTFIHRYYYNSTWYACIIDGFFTAILPFIALLGLNVRLIVEIRRSSQYLRYHLAADSSIQSVISSEQLKITLMLISIIVAFFLCQSPYVIYNAITAFSAFKPVHIPSWFKSFTKILVALKSSCNFVLYCWFSEKFWNTFKRIFCLRYCLPKQMPKGTRANSHNNMHRPSYLVTRETTC